MRSGSNAAFTSSAMSQATTRTTSLVRVIDADDVAGISVLYPAASFSSQFGSISGRVLFTNGQPVHLASVVAIRSGASAVSAFTNPDGTYRIDGIPPRLCIISKRIRCRRIRTSSIHSTPNAIR